MKDFKYYISNNFNKGILNLLESNSIISITNALGTIEYVNDNFCSILEYDEETLIGETLELLKSPLHSNELYKNLWKTIRLGQKWNGILEAKTLKGKMLWLETTIIPVKKDNAFKYVIIYKDITCHQEKNISLLNSDHRYKTFLNEIPINIFTISKYGKITNANKNYHNVDIDHLIGTYIYDYINPRNYGTFKSNINTVFSKKVSKHFETFDNDINGHKRFYTTIISPILDSSDSISSATICIQETSAFKDISPIKQNQEIKYREIYHSTNLGIIVVADKKGNIVEWNKGAELAFGYSELEIIGRPLTFLTSEKYRNTNIRELLKAIKKMRNNQKVDLIEMQCLRKNGETFTVEFALSKLKVDDEIFYCAMMLDISNRIELRNKLEQKTKDLELFLYRSAHDLKAPFASAQGLINLIKEENNNHKINELLEMLEVTINSGKVLSNNLVKASTISAKKHEFKKINFHQCIDDVLKTLRGTNNFNLVKINLNVNVTKPFKSIPELIKSIFQNLIENAIKYSKKPTTDHTPFINVNVVENDTQLILSICDNGYGIKENNLNKIFDLYYRANHFEAPGNGLGLYIVKNIVDTLEGIINVESNPNNGACFEICLPNS